MSRIGRYLSIRHKIALAGIALLAPFALPAQAFFPPVPIRVPVPPPRKPPIHVPTPPPVVVPPVITPPPVGPPSPPQSAPEPSGLVLALLGSGGVSLFVARRRRRARD
jgi:hypothetical protein